jgi:hypothetical protein
MNREEFMNRVSPAGMFLCHKCDVRSCVNPDHLFLGSQADNMADMKSKNRARALASFGPDRINSLVGNRFRVCVYFKTRKQIAKVDRCAKKLGMSRSQLIVAAVKEQCQRDLRGAL